VIITAEPVGETLVLRVEDNGAGLGGQPGKTGGGVGLANLRARLARLYGDAAGLTLAERPGGGTVATLTLPRRVRPASRPSATES
jgi:sensor histidine kinase YesM